MNDGSLASDDDFVEPYLRAVFGLLGITDVTVVRVEGTAVTPETRTKTIAEALDRIPSLLAEAA